MGICQVSNGGETRRIEQDSGRSKWAAGKQNSKPSETIKRRRLSRAKPAKLEPCELYINLHIC